jgi:hypothetical protein
MASTIQHGRVLLVCLILASCSGGKGHDPDGLSDPPVDTVGEADGDVATEPPVDVASDPTPDPVVEPAEEPGEDPATEPEEDPDEDPGDDPGDDAEDDPGDDADDDPGDDASADASTETSTDAGTDGSSSIIWCVPDPPTDCTGYTLGCCPSDRAAVLCYGGGPYGTRCTTTEQCGPDPSTGRMECM